MRMAWKLVVVGALLGLALTACKPKAAAVEHLVKVAHEGVCMSNNYFMGGPHQTPVALGGKTYYVCCAGCQQSLTKHVKERSAKDPVSGQLVDKADAVIGKLPNNNILYFQNEADLMAYVVPTPTPGTPDATEKAK